MKTDQTNEMSETAGKEPPKLSIVTICYNEKNIEATCLSIKNQLWRNFEWIVIDGGSTDSTLDILKKHEDQISILVSENDRGIYHAMNKGISRASGEYIIFMNGGDYFLDIFALERVFTNFDLNKDIVCCDVMLILEEGRNMLLQFKHFMPITPEFFLDRCISHQATFIKRQLFVMHGGYNEKRRIVADWEKWIELTKIHRVEIGHIETVLAIHHYTGISSIMDETHLNERREVIETYFPDMANSLPPQASRNIAPTIKNRIADKMPSPRGASHYRNYCKVKIFNFILLLRIKKHCHKNNFKYYLLNFIPIGSSTSSITK